MKIKIINFIIRLSFCFGVGLVFFFLLLGIANMEGIAFSDFSSVEVVSLYLLSVLFVMLFYIFSILFSSKSKDSGEEVEPIDTYHEAEPPLENPVDTPIKSLCNECITDNNYIYCSCCGRWYRGY